MTDKARSVLRDCRIALDIMENETDPDKLRVEWIGALALIRLVGHVLKEVDRKDAKFQSAIDSHYKEWIASSDPTFRFIVQSRNAAVKRYEVNLPKKGEINVVLQNGSGGRDIFRLEDCLLMPLEGGWRDGEDARDVYCDLLDWWDYQLSTIEEHC